MRTDKTHETPHARGIQAEEEAARYLEQQGFDVMHTRYKTKFGEIDLIAQKDGLLCFVEVKTRKNKSDALHAVTPRTRRRIEEAALFFLSEHPDYTDCTMRFDVIALAPPAGIIHLDNAWEAGA